MRERAHKGLFEQHKQAAARGRRSWSGRVVFFLLISYQTPSGGFCHIRLTVAALQEVEGVWNERRPGFIKGEGTL